MLLILSGTFRKGQKVQKGSGLKALRQMVKGNSNILRILCLKAKRLKHRSLIQSCI